jgi:hypothetical protein
MRRWAGAAAVDALSHTVDLRLVETDGGVGLYRADEGRD